MQYYLDIMHKFIIEVMIYKMNNSVKQLFDNIKDGYKINSNIEIVDASKVIIEEMIKLIEYCNTKIIIDVGKNLLIINGDNLNICDYYNKNIVIEGKVSSVIFE